MKILSIIALFSSGSMARDTAPPSDGDPIVVSLKLDDHYKSVYYAEMHQPSSGEEPRVQVLSDVVGTGFT